MLNLGGLGNDYELQKGGVLSLGSLALPPLQGVFSGPTQKGDYVRSRIAVGNPHDGIRYDEKVMVDVAGEGPGSLHYVDSKADLYGTFNQPPSFGSVVYHPGLTPDTTVPLSSVYRDPAVGQVVVSKPVSPQGDSTEQTANYTIAPDVLTPVEPQA